MNVLTKPRQAPTRQEQPVKPTVMDDPRRKLLAAGEKSRADFPTREVYQQQEVPSAQE